LVVAESTKPCGVRPPFATIDAVPKGEDEDAAEEVGGNHDDERDGLEMIGVDEGIGEGSIDNMGWV
jgi:hypothetical protein